MVWSTPYQAFDEYSLSLLMTECMISIENGFIS